MKRLKKLYTRFKSLLSSKPSYETLFKAYLASSFLYILLVVNQFSPLWLLLLVPVLMSYQTLKSLRLPVLSDLLEQFTACVLFLIIVYGAFFVAFGISGLRTVLGTLLWF